MCIANGGDLLLSAASRPTFQQASQEVAHEEERDYSCRCTWVSIYEKHEGEWAQVVDAPFFQFQTTDAESGSEENRQAVES